MQRARARARRGVFHCDVAPRNLVIGEREWTATLVDFGAAVDMLAAREPTVMGTPGYVAPEIIRGSGPSPHSDLYSLGVVAYRLLGGPPAFRRRGRDTTAPRLTTIPPFPSLADLRPDLPCALTGLVERSMAAHPAGTPASIAEFRRGLLEPRTHAATLQHAA